jgi:hypothetical protein
MTSRVRFYCGHCPTVPPCEGDTFEEVAKLWNQTGWRWDDIRADLLPQPTSEHRCPHFQPKGEDSGDAYNAGIITDVTNELVFPEDRTRLNAKPTSWYSSLIKQLIQRIANLRVMLAEARSRQSASERRCEECGCTVELQGQDGRCVLGCKCEFAATGAADLISRDHAMRAMCFMCAKPERYGPPQETEGSKRLFHFQIADGWNAGQCFAQPILNIPVAATNRDAGEGRPNIICLCGSTRFIELFAIKTWELEREGNIVLGCTLLPMWYCNTPDHFGEATGTKEQCDELHKRKIDLADEVFVLDVDRYIGASTKSEIEYAIATGKPVRYLSQTTPADATEGEPHRCLHCGRVMKSDFDLDVGMWYECENCNYRETVSSAPTGGSTEGEPLTDVKNG